MKNYKIQNGCHNCKHLAYAYDYPVCGLVCRPPKRPVKDTLEHKRLYHERCLRLANEYGVDKCGICPQWAGKYKRPEKGYG